MALWPFRRKSRRKRPRSSNLSGDDSLQHVPRSQTLPESATAEPLRQQSVKKQRTESRDDLKESGKLQRRARTYSFESGRRDSLHVKARRRSRQARGSVPPVPNIDNGESNRHDTTLDENDEMHRVPTLHANKRDGQHLVQRKSSKRRKNSHDRVREAELKAMSNFTPQRPATDAWTAGRPMKKDTRRVRTGLGIGIGNGGRANWDREHTSEVSLPIPGSIHSSLSSDSDQISYRISALDSLAPKPTLRYLMHPRGSVPPPGATMPQRTSSQRKKLSEREPIPEATIKAHKRIHDLADDLSASDLRELMERDQRRRERKHQKDQDRIEKRLARRAEKERLAAAAGSPASPNLERGVLGREAVGLGIDSTSAVVTSSKRRNSNSSSARRRPYQPAEDAEAHLEKPPAPVDAFHRTDSIPLDSLQQTPADEHGDVLPPQPASPKLKSGLLRPKKTRSASPPIQEGSILETARKGSESSSSRGPMSWASIFRWGNKNRRSSGPSSFSNTSRDSMATTTPQPPAPAAAPEAVAFSAAPVPGPIAGPARKLSSSVPRRTLSRFREDLPEFPITPPESRIQSPEAEPLPTPIIEQDSPSAQEDRGSNRHQVYDNQRLETPTSDRHSSANRDEYEPSPEPPQSMSLASIDSEASWLSGRLAGRRRSSQQPIDSTSNSRQSNYRPIHSAGSGESEQADGEIVPDEDVSGIVEDEYIGRVHGRSSRIVFARDSVHRKSAGEPQPSSDEEDDARWGAVGGRTPTVVSARAADRVKSREGMLNSFGEEEELETPDLESPLSPASENEPDLQRATSINLGRGHVRHISAGSARLLDLTPRSSVDAKRRSVEPRV